MFGKGYLMDNLGLFSIGLMSGLTIFVGLGNTILVTTLKEDVWMVGLIALILGLIPIYLLTKIMNYSPSLNLFEKIDSLFNKYLAFIIKLIFFLVVLSILIFSSASIGMFSQSKYLNATPLIFIIMLFIGTAFYGASKGLETISRTSLIILYIFAIIFCFIVIDLSKLIDIENIKPILANGYKPLLIGSLQYLSYAIIPFLTILIIPKDKIKNKEKASKALLYGYIFSTLIMSIVFFMNLTIAGYELTKMYRYPEYYILRNISIGNAISNVENILSVIWTYNIFVTMMMALYFISKFVENIIKKDDKKTNKIILFVFSIIAIIISSNLFKSDTVMVLFMKDKYPLIYGLSSLIMVLIIIIKIGFKKKTT